MNDVFSARRALTVGVLTLCLALLAVLCLSPTSARALAPAQPIDPAAVTALEIHKFEQPEHLGAGADGLPQDTTGLTAVPGATFTATRVPGIDLMTNAGQLAAENLTVEAATLLVASQPASGSGTTDANGNASIAPLGVGLYFVQETVTPAGFVGSVPFLVTLPLTHPVLLDRWLSTVHVYPKNARVSISLEVTDRDAVTLGNTVGWLSKSGIPTQPVLDGYRVVQRIDPALRLVGDGSQVTVGFDVVGTPTLVSGTHYALNIDPVTGWITIDVLPAGLTVLAQVVRDHPGARLAIGYRTTVLGDGELVNEALLYPSKASIDGAPDAPAPLSATNVTKWGPLAVRVHERGNPTNLIQGAGFKVYLSAQDAARGTNPIVVNGVDEWVSDSDGMLRVPGLRFSGFADGLDRDVNEPLFRYYYVMPSFFPPGWTGVKVPLATTVFSTTDVNVITVVLWKESADDLTTTGGPQIAGLSILGALLIGGGLLFFVRRHTDRQRENATP